MNIRCVVELFVLFFLQKIPPILLTTQVHLSNGFLGNYNVWIPEAKQTKKHKPKQTKTKENPPKKPHKQTNNKPKSTALPKLKEMFQ